jgi:hypothetical protein
MSGPKCGQYTVVSTEELRRRRLSAARDRHARALRELDALAADLRAAVATYGDLAVVLPDVVTPADLEPEAWELATERLADEIERGREAMGVATREERIRHMVASVGSLTASVTTVAPGGAHGQDDTELERVLARLPATARADSVERCTVLANSFTGTRDQRERRQLLAVVRLAVQREQDRERLIEKNRNNLELLYQQLDGLVGRPVETLRGMLKGLPLDEPLPDDLEDRVARTRDTARAEEDRTFVLQAASAALKDLGYSVGEHFRTAVVDDGALVDLPHSDRHALRVRERNHQLMFNIVRYDETGGRDLVADTRAEESFCTDFAGISSKFRELGIDLTMLRADPPGSHPVQVVKEGPRRRALHQTTRPTVRRRRI